MLKPKDNVLSFTASLLPRFALAPLAQASHIATRCNNETSKPFQDVLDA